MLTASVTGAGLVIAFYALIARMSDSIFSCRFELLEEKTQEIERIRSNPASFKEDNLQKTSSRLKELGKEIDAIKAFPRYLGIGIGINFGLFILVSMICANWLYLYTQPNNPTQNDWLIVALFMFTVGFFGVVGAVGIADVRDTMKIQFKNLAKKKKEIKEEIKYAPKEAETVAYIESCLAALKVDFKSNVPVKVDGKLLRPDIIIPSETNPKYLIEVLARPSSDLIYRLSANYEQFKAETHVKTIVIADFEGRLPLIDLAKAYWDFVIDMGNEEDMDRLKKILTK
jgi:hypothetical protein